MRVMYYVYNPQGEHIKTFFTRHGAKTFINLKNEFTPSWHYDELYKMRAVVERDTGTE